MWNEGKNKLTGSTETKRFQHVQQPVFYFWLLVSTLYSKAQSVNLNFCVMWSLASNSSHFPRGKNQMQKREVLMVTRERGEKRKNMENSHNLKNGDQSGRTEVRLSICFTFLSTYSMSPVHYVFSLHYHNRELLTTATEATDNSVICRSPHTQRITLNGTTHTTNTHVNRCKSSNINVLQDVPIPSKIMLKTCGAIHSECAASATNAHFSSTECLTESRSLPWI